MRSASLHPHRIGPELPVVHNSKRTQDCRFKRATPSGRSIRGDGVNLPTGRLMPAALADGVARGSGCSGESMRYTRSEEHTSELQSLMRSSYAFLCLKQKKTTTK